MSFNSSFRCAVLRPLVILFGECFYPPMRKYVVVVCVGRAWHQRVTKSSTDADDKCVARREEIRKKKKKHTNCRDGVIHSSRQNQCASTIMDELWCRDYYRTPGAVWNKNPHFVGMTCYFLNFVLLFQWKRKRNCNTTLQYFIHSPEQHDHIWTNILIHVPFQFRILHTRANQMQPWLKSIWLYFWASVGILLLLLLYCCANRPAT